MPKSTWSGQRRSGRNWSRGVADKFSTDWTIVGQFSASLTSYWPTVADFWRFFELCSMSLVQISWFTLFPFSHHRSSALQMVQHCMAHCPQLKWKPNLLNCWSSSRPNLTLGIISCCPFHANAVHLTSNAVQQSTIIVDCTLTPIVPHNHDQLTRNCSQASPHCYKRLAQHTSSLKL